MKNSILILHREVEDMTQMPTLYLNNYHESMMPSFRGSYYRASDGKEAFRLNGNEIIFLRDPASSEDIDAALELLRKKGAKEVLPNGEDTFLLAVHAEAYRLFQNDMEVIHPDILELRQEIEQKYFEEAQNKPRRKFPRGPRRRIQ